MSKPTAAEEIEFLTRQVCDLSAERTQLRLARAQLLEACERMADAIAALEGISGLAGVSLQLFRALKVGEAAIAAVTDERSGCENVSRQTEKNPTGRENQ